MGHQPFESWLLSAEPLVPEDERRLQDHVDTCESCRELTFAWGEVESLFRESTLEEPTPGFANRWQIRLENLVVEQRVRRQKFISWGFISLTGGVAILVLTVMVVLFFTTVQSPIQVFVSGITFFAGLLALMSAFQVAFFPALEVIFTGMPPMLWFMLFIALSLSILLTTISIRRFIFPRRVAL